MARIGTSREKALGDPFEASDAVSGSRSSCLGCSSKPSAASSVRARVAELGLRFGRVYPEGDGAHDELRFTLDPTGAACAVAVQKLERRACSIQGTILL